MNFDTIAAIATPSGQGAIGMIRVSGKEAIERVSQIFSKDLREAKGYSLHYGHIKKDQQILDEVVLSVFRGPKSFTREDTVEISFHGSAYILRTAMQWLSEVDVRPALPGEFTQRAYLNGAMDLAQAEAVADLIASASAGAHQLAMQQLRGGISNELSQLREQLLNFTSLIELELDFGEEDVEFADRSQLGELVHTIEKRLSDLISSFQFGNAVKEGVPTVIMGKPNAGKSTLMNALLNDNRAIVSDIAGTTRDVIEDRLVIDGIEFRLMDTAGLRKTADIIEAEGVSRTLDLAKRASLVLYLFDATKESLNEAADYLKSLDLPEGAHIIFIGNKVDLLDDNPSEADHVLYLSAKSGGRLDPLRQAMTDSVHQFGHSNSDQAIISNARHLHALTQAQTSLHEVRDGLANGLTGDLLAIDIRRVLHFIGEITGEISTDEVLGNIFSKFCIGK
ncbi:MAG: tRNA uridine-5-carboxymethylaminomethyl(34) synthesis GTPase MnmE [Bacteroidota bacterium]